MIAQTILFPNVKTFNTKRIREVSLTTSFIVAIDGGADNAFKLQITPHIVIGDMDSISSKAKTIIKKKKIEILKYPKEKDETDFELAIDYLLSKGVKNIVIAGLSGCRIDHALANWMILTDLYMKGYLENIKVLEKDQTIDFSNKKWFAKVNKGDLISIIPLHEGAGGISTYGLKFKLRNDNLKFGTSRGISNIAQEKKVMITIKGGAVIVVHRHNR